VSELIRLTQSQNVRGDAGTPLPTAFEAFDTIGFQFVRGQLALISAGPGTGKSAFVLTVALRTGLPTLYFSADSDAFTQLTRSIAITNDWTLDDAKDAVRSDDLSRVRSLNDTKVFFSFDASPTLDEIEAQIAAWQEAFEDYPAIIIVDNVTNVVTSADDDDPFSGLEALMDYLHDMARQTGACVIALHHVTGSYNNAEVPIPLDGVKGQITRVPEMVLTLHRRQAQVDFQTDTMCVSVVKNRNGKSDPSGKTFAELEFIGERMLIRDFTA
jgi:replicative DNA helicase